MIKFISVSAEMKHKNSSLIINKTMLNSTKIWDYFGIYFEWFNPVKTVIKSSWDINLIQQKCKNLNKALLNSDRNATELSKSLRKEVGRYGGQV